MALVEERIVRWILVTVAWPQNPAADDGASLGMVEQEMGSPLISGILGFLCTCAPLCVLGLVAIFLLLITRIFSHKTKAKGRPLSGKSLPGQRKTSHTNTGLAVGGQQTSRVKSSQERRRKNARGATTDSEGVEGSTKTLNDGWEKPHGGGQWGSDQTREEASARELPRQTEDVAQGGNSTSTELLGNQLPTTDMQERTRLLLEVLGIDAEELTVLLMESLDITQICRDLLGKLKEVPDRTSALLSGAVRKKHLLCPQCGQCFTGHCPHCHVPTADQDLPTLTAILHTLNIPVHEGDLLLEVGLVFELAINGEPVFVWERTQRFPKNTPKRCCKSCNSPLPRSPRDNRPAQQHVGYGGSRPMEASRWPQPPSPAAVERLLRAGTEALPQVGFRGVGTGLSLQCIRHSWHKAKASAWRTMEEECHWMWISEEPAPSSTREGDEELQREVDAHYHVTLMDV